MNQLEIVVADLNRLEHQRDVVALTAAYALDPMGNGAPLPMETLERLIDGLRHHLTTLILLAYVENQAVGIATCFLGFSTFAAKPLINIHDLAVLPRFRGRGIGSSLLNAVEDKGRQLECCKLTLEVYEKNRPARHVYESAGFAHGNEVESGSGFLFYTKRLSGAGS